MTRIRRLSRVLGYGFAALVFLVLVASAAERVAWAGKVLPGVELTGTSVSGKSDSAVTDEVTDAAARFEREPFVVRAGEHRLTLDPRRIGLSVDAPVTVRDVQDAGRTGNPVGQVMGTILRLTRPEEIPWSVSWDEEALDEVLAAWEAEVASDATDGTLRFEDGDVVPVPPRKGQVLARPGADSVLVEALRSGDRDGIVLPIETRQPEITREEVQRAAGEARELLSGAVTVRIEDVTVRITPDELASMLRTEAKGASLRLRIDHERLRAVLGPDAVALEGDPEAARFEVVGSSVEIVPHRLGTRLDLEQISTAILRGDRLVRGELSEQKPETTTEDLEALKVTELVSTFTTHYPAGQSRVTNIHRAAELLDRTVIPAGGVFSLNEALGQRTRERGFVVAGVIYGGEFTEDVGGGVSQFATTLFNAVFFGGYPIPEYQAHSYYISRYPMGREATVSWPSPDLRFKNDTDAAILMRSSVSSTSLTVSFYSTKIRDVDAEGPVVLETIPPPEEFEGDPSLDRGERDVRSPGSEGRIVRVTRVVHDLDGEEIDRRVFTTRYRPEPREVGVHPCDHPDESERPPAEQCRRETTTTTQPDGGGGDGGDGGGTTTTTAGSG